MDWSHSFSGNWIFSTCPYRVTGSMMRTTLHWPDFNSPLKQNCTWD